MCDGRHTHTQHRPIFIKINTAIRLRNFVFRRRYNLKKAYWQNHVNDIDKRIANITPTSENYDKFVNLVKREDPFNEDTLKR